MSDRNLIIVIAAFLIGALLGILFCALNPPTYPKQPTVVRDQLHKYRIFMIQCAYYKEANTEIWKKCDEMYQTLVE